MLDVIGTFWRGMFLGFIIAAPIGPVGLLCIRRTVQKGFAIGLATGLGAAVADSLFGTLSVYGIGAILDFIHRYAAPIRVVGGLIVLGSAWHGWRDKPKPESPLKAFARFLHLTQERPVKDALEAAGGGFLVTVTNPVTLFGSLAVIATFGGLTTGLTSKLLILGIFAGSVLWWVVLSGGIALVRRKFNERAIVTVNRVTAVCLAGLGIWAVVSGLHGLMRP